LKNINLSFLKIKFFNSNDVCFGLVLRLNSLLIATVRPVAIFSRLFEKVQSGFSTE